MLNLHRKDTKNSLFKDEDLSRYVLKLSMNGFVRSPPKAYEAYQNLMRSPTFAKYNHIDIAALWKQPEGNCEEKWTEIATHATTMYNALLMFRDLLRKFEDGSRGSEIQNQRSLSSGSHRLATLVVLTKTVIDIHYCIVMEFIYTYEKLADRNPKPVKEFSDVLKSHFSVSYLRGKAIIEALTQFSNEADWFFQQNANSPAVSEFREKIASNLQMGLDRPNFAKSQITYFYQFSVYIMDLLNLNEFPNNYRSLFEDLRICFQVIATYIASHSNQQRKSCSDLLRKIISKLDNGRNKLKSDDLQTLRMQSYINHVGLQKQVEVLVSDEKRYVEMTAVLLLVDNGLLILNQGHDQYRSSIEPILKELDANLKSAKGPGNKHDAFIYLPFPFHVKAKGSNSMTITDVPGVKGSFGKTPQGPIVVTFIDESGESRGSRKLTLDEEMSRDQWISWCHGSLLLRTREVVKACAFLPYRGDLRTNMTARLDLTNSQIEFITNKWMDDCSHLFGIKRKGAFLYPGYKSEQLKDTFDPQNTDFQRRKWFNEDFETWIMMFDELNELERLGMGEQAKLGGGR